MLWGMNRSVDGLYNIRHLKLTWDIGVRPLDNTLIKGSDTGKNAHFLTALLPNKKAPPNEAPVFNFRCQFY